MNVSDPEFDLNLQKHSLHEECARQPKLFRHYADKLTTARKAWEIAKLDKEILEAELQETADKVALEVRQIPEKWGFPADKKPTEDAIKETVRTRKRYKEAQTKVFDKARQLIDLRHDVDVYEKLLESIGYQCKNGLPDLVKLRMADYFADPKPRKDDREKVESYNERAAFGGKKKK